MSNSITYLSLTLIFEGHVVRGASKNRHHNDMYVNKIELHAQNMITILSSIINIIEEDLYDHLMHMEIVTLIMNQIFIEAWKL